MRSGFNAFPTSPRLFSETPVSKLPTRSPQYLESVHPNPHGRHCHCGSFDQSVKRHHSSTVSTSADMRSAQSHVHHRSKSYLHDQSGQSARNDTAVYDGVPMAMQTKTSSPEVTFHANQFATQNERIQEMLRLIAKMKTKYCECPPGPRVSASTPKTRYHGNVSVSGNRSPSRQDFNSEMSRALREYV